MLDAREEIYHGTNCGGLVLAIGLHSQVGAQARAEEQQLHDVAGVSNAFAGAKADAALEASCKADEQGGGAEMQS